MYKPSKNWALILITDSYNVYIENVTLQFPQYLEPAVSGSLTVHNILGKSVIANVWSNELRIIYTDSNEELTKLDHKLIVINFIAEFYDYEFQNREEMHSGEHEIFSWILSKTSETLPAVSLVLKQSSYTVTFKLINTTFVELNYNKILLITSSSYRRNVITIENCTFRSNRYSNTQNSIIVIQQSVCKSNLEGNGVININHCSFTNNQRRGGILAIEWIVKECLNLPREENKTNPLAEYSISYCSFENNSALILIRLNSTTTVSIVLHIIKTRFKNFKDYEYDPPWPVAAIYASNVKLYFSDVVIFHEVSVKYGLLHTNEDIFISNNITFSRITALSLINGSRNHKINLVDDALVNIINMNIMENLFSLKSTPDLLYPPCYFQYQRRLHSNITGSQKIIMTTENINKSFDISTGNINCWFEQNTMYHRLNPLTVYLQHIEMEHKDVLFNTGFLCYCKGVQPNCHTNILGSLYPGQKLIFNVSLNPVYFKVIKSKIMTAVLIPFDPNESVCRVSSLLEAKQLVERKCTTISYTILSDRNTHCKLFLHNDYYLTIYYIKLLNCPAGFSLSTDTLNKKCICDPVLVINGIILSCNIDDQTISRPANSWISATTHNNSYTYHISLHCPFHYCLPHSSHLNFSTPNLQCQFNRSGVLCGHCQQGLSTVFSSSHCKTCSNVFLLLIIPIIVIGFVLVLLLFLLNLTVTDGAINGFILYANIISINTPVFFPSTFTPAYTFISLANLDLGIQTCFYNGMDDYAKMWLQLAFPFYLIFIATLIIITSRYSTKIQRLTARRVLPVLATLFLLSYTKILRIVSSVLFFYSTITHLPSKHTTLAWSVDPTVPLFGVWFTILFTMCLILFLILVPFNVILLFTRTLSRFRFVNKFKPLLDAYQGPYKNKFYYWTGLQLLIRAVVFGTSSLDRNVSLTVGIALFSIIEGIQGALKPFKNDVKNFQEQLFLMNITILYAIILYNQEAINTMAVNIMITMAAFHFTLIILYHIITYVCSTAIKNKSKSCSDKISKQITMLKWKSQTVHQFELQANVRCNIPEAVNYHEFQESLLNQD